MNQGDIVLIEFPFTDLTHSKIRPALIVSSNEFNQHFEPYFCPVTSKKVEQGTYLNNALTFGWLDKESYAKTSTIATIHPERVIQRIGAINKETIKAIIAQLKRNLE